VSATTPHYLETWLTCYLPGVEGAPSVVKTCTCLRGGTSLRNQRDRSQQSHMSPEMKLSALGERCKPARWLQNGVQTTCSGVVCKCTSSLCPLHTTRQGTCMGDWGRGLQVWGTAARGVRRCIHDPGARMMSACSRYTLVASQNLRQYGLGPPVRRIINWCFESAGLGMEMGSEGLYTLVIAVSLSLHNSTARFGLACYPQRDRYVRFLWLMEGSRSICLA
jgi:hypothetical protein